MAINITALPTSGSVLKRLHVVMDDLSYIWTHIVSLTKGF